MSEGKEHLLLASLPWWALAFLAWIAKKPVHWQPSPEALTKGGEIEGQVRVGAPAPEGDAVQGALHGVPAAARAGGACPHAMTVRLQVTQAAVSAVPPRAGRDPGPAARRVGTAGRASP